MTQMLPVEDVLPKLQAALVQGTCAVLVAPPGAGKTTRVPLALLEAPWRGSGKVLVLEPRRLAVRAAAARMAQTLGEPVGGRVGYRVRMDSRTSAATLIEVVTEGVFVRMILDDPSLEGVACVIFDEFHERSLDADLALALALDAQGLLRNDLRLLVMSATLDGAAVAAMLDQAPVIESHGRAYEVETRYRGRDARLRLEDDVARTVHHALVSDTGNLLVFLPGQGEIRRTADILNERLNRQTHEVVPLYGGLDLADQDRAIAPPAPGVRKIVLATSIAETSLTIEGVRVVIDCGLARVPRYDPASGLTRLVTVRVSQAAANQRRGRAGRTEPGVAYRLWDEAETRALLPFGRPEILEADLAGLVLDLAQWGAREADDLKFLTPPPGAAYAEAKAVLRSLGALTDSDVLTPHGRAIGGLPLAPRLAHMILKAGKTGQAHRAALIAVLITEQGLGGREVDLSSRLDGLARDRTRRATDARALAKRWSGQVNGKARHEPVDDGLLLALAYPERIAKARGPLGAFQLVSGRGAFLEATDGLARSSWLAVGELGGGERRDRILLAAPLDEADLVRIFASELVAEYRLETRDDGKITARRLTRLGQLTVREEIDPKPSPELIGEALLGQVRRQGLDALPWSDGARSLRARWAFVKALDPEMEGDLTDVGLTAGLEIWLAPLLLKVRALGELRPADLEAALREILSWQVSRRLDDLAPARWTAPTGNSFAIDYAAPAGPSVEVRVQECFGLTDHPMLAGGRVRLTLLLLSPGHRPVQTTKDLPGFWGGSWKEVRSEMRGRYPKHVWPEDPANTTPTARAKPRR